MLLFSLEEAQLQLQVGGIKMVRRPQGTGSQIAKPGANSPQGRPALSQMPSRPRACLPGLLPPPPQPQESPGLPPGPADPSSCLRITTPSPNSCTLSGSSGVVGQGLGEMKVSRRAALGLEPAAISFPGDLGQFSQPHCFPASSLAKGEDAGPLLHCEELTCGERGEPLPDCQTLG